MASLRINNCEQLKLSSSIANNKNVAQSHSRIVAQFPRKGFCRNAPRRRTKKTKRKKKKCNKILWTRARSRICNQNVLAQETVYIVIAAGKCLMRRGKLFTLLEWREFHTGPMTQTNKQKETCQRQPRGNLRRWNRNSRVQNA